MYVKHLEKLLAQEMCNGHEPLCCYFQVSLETKAWASRCLMKSLIFFSWQPPLLDKILHLKYFKLVFLKVCFSDHLHQNHPEQLSKMWVTMPWAILKNTKV